MVSAATLDDVQEFVRRGRFDPDVIFTADTCRPEAGTAVTVTWDFADTGEHTGLLEIPGIDAIYVALAGQRQVPVGAEPLVLTLGAGGCLRRLIIEPQVTIPRIQYLHAPRKHLIGEPADVSWHTMDADSCTLIVADGDATHESPVSATGSRQVIPQHVGVLQLRLVARGRHADLSDKAVVERRAVITVLQQPVTMEVTETSKTGFFGDELCFPWTITGAVRAELVFPVRDNLVRPIPLTGRLYIEVGTEEERICLRAVATDGHIVEKELRVIPTFVDRSAIDLSAIHKPWR